MLWRVLYGAPAGWDVNLGEMRCWLRGKVCDRTAAREPVTTAPELVPLSGNCRLQGLCACLPRSPSLSAV